MTPSGGRASDRPWRALGWMDVLAGTPLGIAGILLTHGRPHLEDWPYLFAAQALVSLVSGAAGLALMRKAGNLWRALAIVLVCAGTAAAVTVTSSFLVVLLIVGGLEFLLRDVVPPVVAPR